MKQKSGLCIHLKKSGEQVDLIRPLKKEACFHPKLDLVLYFGTPFQTYFFDIQEFRWACFWLVKNAHILVQAKKRLPKSISNIWLF